MGSLAGYFLHLNQRIVAGIMAFGSGALISALSFELVEEAYRSGGLASTAVGFVLGAVIYSLANWMVSLHGAKHRKRSAPFIKDAPPDKMDNSLAIAVGALLDGIPESIVIGLGLIGGGAASAVTIAAIFVSNVPEGLSSSVGMKNSGKSMGYILGVWTSIAVACSISAGLGFIFFDRVSAATIALIMAVAAGAILAMIVDTMIPEAFAETHDFAGFITVVGFLCAFILDKI